MTLKFDENTIGKSGFRVSRFENGITIMPVFIDESGNFLEIGGLSAVFPNLEESLLKLDELKNMVIDEFLTLAKESGAKEALLK